MTMCRVAVMSWETASLQMEAGRTRAIERPPQVREHTRVHSIWPCMSKNTMHLHVGIDRARMDA